VAEYQSSVLRCHSGDDGCDVCAFLDGSRDERVLLEVIRILDAEAAKQEKRFDMAIDKMVKYETYG
jgi:hypothetical protein